MDTINRVIRSQESTDGIFIQVFGIVLLLPAITLLCISTDTKSPATYLFSGFFLSFSILLLTIGTYQKRKFYKLGKTPLTLTPSFCTIGEEFKGSIEIGRPNFNSVKEITITLWRRSKTAGDESRQDKVWESSSTAKINHVNGTTILEFSFTIPHDKKPTNKGFFSNNKYFWEASFEFVESMQSIKRTWEIPVKI
ncbi:hypothetical protein Q4561_16685 [Alteromonas sp. 1_MG-2023]|uniref:hypothetical protein n=1 Tax=Alteromonas sp. 1_MG-2023 TaxID=3062669 RepID=UPI0026E40EE8|nr:hypothetical protein [Alteromonas sp. 1_MG-2023]MDO6568711.1 hypothetical protein [Alteromonas sp. 1_MG-2023]